MNLRRRFTVISTVLVVLGLGAAPSQAAGPAPVAHPASAGISSTQNLVAVSHDVPGAIVHAMRLGPATVRTMHLVFSLQPRNRAGLTTYLRQVSDHKSRLYHHFLSRRELAARYLPSASSEQTLARWLRANGFTVTKTYKTHVIIDASAPLATVQRALHLTMGNYRLNGRTFYANDAVPYLPASVAGLLSGIVGLSNYARIHNHLVKGATLSTRLTRKTAGAVSAYTPPAIAHAYGLDNTGLDGTGVDIAIVTLGSISTTDVSTFWSAYNISRTLPTIIPVDPESGDTTVLNDESTLDAEWAGATAPGANIQVYEAPPSPTDGSTTEDMLVDTFGAVLDATDTDLNLQVVSTSWGGCEADLMDPTTGQPYDVDSTNDILSSMDALGMSIVAASGDHGSQDGCSDGHIGHADYPASDPYVTAVGGTSVTLSDGVTGTITSETTWNLSGGGVSGRWDAPWYQVGQGVPTQTADPWRNTSDVSMHASLSPYPYVYYYNGSVQTAGGTSFGAPQWAGIIAQLDESLGAPSATEGNLTSDIYQYMGTNPVGFPPLRDITTGCNDHFCAGAGWDFPTGWGSPAAARLIDVFSGYAGNASPSTDDWTQYQHDAAHSGANDNEYLWDTATGNNVLPGWSWPVGVNVDGQAVVSNGTVYVAGMSGRGGIVTALDSNTGGWRWNYTTPGINIVTTPAVANGLVYVTAQNGTVIALNATTGAKVWSDSTGSPIAASPVVYHNTVYVGNDNGNGGTMYALNGATGALAWSYSDDIGTGIDTTAAVNNNMLTYGDNVGDFYGLSATGHQTTTVMFADTLTDTIPILTGTPSFFDNTEVAVPTSQSKLFSFWPSTDPYVGGLDWEYQTGGLVTDVANGVDANGYQDLFAGSTNGNLYALDPYTGTLTGTLPAQLVWSKSVGPVRVAPIAFSNTVLVASGATLSALSQVDGTLLWRKTVTDTITSTSIQGGAIYVGTQHGMLLTFILDMQDSWFTWYDAQTTNNRDWIAIGNPKQQAFPLTTTVNVYVAGAFQGSYAVTPGGKTLSNVFANGKVGVKGGPVRVAVRGDGDSLSITQRAFINTSFEEVPARTFGSTQQFFTFYDGITSKNLDWIMVSNISTTTANVSISMPNVTTMHLTVPAGGNQSVKLYDTKGAAARGGPVEVDSNVPVQASQRTIILNDFNELWSTPAEYFSGVESDYWFTFADSPGAKGLDWILVAYPSSLGYTSTAALTITVAGNVLTTTQMSPGGLQAFRLDALSGGNPVRGGPVEVRADPIVGSHGPVAVLCSQRSLWGGAAFEEVPGALAFSMPTQQVLPLYDKTAPNGGDWVMVSNITELQEQITITVGSAITNVLLSPIPSQSVSEGNNFRDGPITAVSVYSGTNDAAPVLMSQRTLWFNGADFNEVLPDLPSLSQG